LYSRRRPEICFGADVLVGESSNPLAGASGPVLSPATIAKYRRSAFEVLKAELKADWEFVGKRLAREITANLFKISYLQQLSSAGFRAEFVEDRWDLERSFRFDD
jgi:hypothetical protein